MTKVYLVLAFQCNKHGRMIKESESVYEVFTNKRLADKAVDYLNKEWRKAFSTKDFSKVKWFTVQTSIISHVDYSKLSY